jgi:hypothetical protein
VCEHGVQKKTSDLAFDAHMAVGAPYATFGTWQAKLANIFSRAETEFCNLTHIL